MAKGCVLGDSCAAEDGKCDTERLLNLNCDPEFNLSKARCYICGDNVLCFESDGRSPFCKECAKTTVLTRRFQMAGIGAENAGVILGMLENLSVRAQEAV